MFDHFPQFDETLRHIELAIASSATHTAKSAETFLSSVSHTHKTPLGCKESEQRVTTHK